MTKVLVFTSQDYDLNLITHYVSEIFSDFQIHISAHQKILIKPNVLCPARPEQAITTHPVLIEAVCCLLKDHGCSIVIADSSSTYHNHGTLKAFQECGITAVAERYDAELIAFESSSLINYSHNDAKVLKYIPLSSLIKECDGLINMPKLKTHSLMKYTGAVKNLYGCLPGGLKLKYHAIGNKPFLFTELILDLYEIIREKILLNIMDGILALEGDGPGTAGMAIKFGRIIASQNALALDVVAGKMIGYELEEIPTNKAGIQRNLIQQNAIVTIGNNSITYLRKPKTLLGWNRDNFFLRLFSSQPWIYELNRSYPRLVRKSCVRCQTCYRNCPVHAIRMEEFPLFLTSECISCFCCHEVCPEAAIVLEKHGVMKVLQKIKSALKR